MIDLATLEQNPDYQKLTPENQARVRIELSKRQLSAETVESARRRSNPQPGDPEFYGDPHDVASIRQAAEFRGTADAAIPGAMIVASPALIPTTKAMAVGSVAGLAAGHAVESAARHYNLPKGIQRALGLGASVIGGVAGMSAMGRNAITRLLTAPLRSAGRAVMEGAAEGATPAIERAIARQAAAREAGLNAAHTAAIREAATRESAVTAAHAAAAREAAAREGAVLAAHGSAAREASIRDTAVGAAHRGAVAEQAARESTINAAHREAAREGASRSSLQRIAEIARSRQAVRAAVPSQPPVAQTPELIALRIRQLTGGKITPEIERSLAQMPPAQAAEIRALLMRGLSRPATTGGGRAAAGPAGTVDLEAALRASLARGVR